MIAGKRYSVLVDILKWICVKDFNLPESSIWWGCHCLCIFRYSDSVHFAKTSENLTNTKHCARLCLPAGLPTGLNNCNSHCYLYLVNSVIWLGGGGGLLTKLPMMTRHKEILVYIQALLKFAIFQIFWLFFYVDLFLSGMRKIIPFCLCCFE